MRDNIQTPLQHFSFFDFPPFTIRSASHRQDTGDYECQVCGWQYKEEKGFGPYPAGTAFAALPADFKYEGTGKEKRKGIGKRQRAQELEKNR
jgi:rubredoxin